MPKTNPLSVSLHAGANRPRRSTGWRLPGWRLALTVGLLGLGTGCAQPEPWNVLLVTFDTTRADHLGCYGNTTIETPNLDRLAAEGVRFDQTYSAAPITAPSHSTIITGRYPLAHGVRDNGLFVLGDENETLAEILKGAGYATAAAVGAFPLDSQFGLDQGFDTYDDHFTVAFEDLRGRRTVSKRALFFDERRASLVNEALFPWLDDNHEKPFFAWAHYFDPHQPFEPPPPYRETYANDLYDGEIAFADEAFGQLMRRLEALGVADRTVVIMTADHGDGLGEHNETTHSTLAYNSTLHVPLLMRIPGHAGGLTVAQRVGTVDIVPTILDVLGLPIPGAVQGASLRPLIEHQGAETTGFPRSQYAETLSPRLSQGLGELRVLFDRQYKYIFGPRPELYDLDDDVRERNNLVAAEPDVAEGMKRRLASFIERHVDQDATKAVSLDDETRRRLEALGYIQGSGGDALSISETLDGSGIAPQDRVGDVNEMSAAKYFLHNGRPAAALGALAPLLQREPDSPYYLQLAAAAQLQLNQIDTALETIDRVRERDPEGLSNQPLMLHLVTHLYYNGRAPKALELLTGHIERQPTANAYWYLSSLHAALGDEAASKAALDEALELDPTFGPARVDLGVRFARAGDVAQARAAFERAIADQPYYPKAHFNYGALLLDSESAEAAEPHFARAAALKPSYAEAHHALVTLALRRGDRDAARRHLANLVAAAPGSAIVQAAQQAVQEAS